MLLKVIEADCQPVYQSQGSYAVRSDPFEWQVVTHLTLPCFFVFQPLLLLRDVFPVPLYSLLCVFEDLGLHMQRQLL